MRITPQVTQQNGMILVSLVASFVGDTNDTVDKANIIAFGDPMVNLTGGTFVDNATVAAIAASLVHQNITFTVAVAGPAANAVTIQFLNDGDTADASAVSASGDAIQVQIQKVGGAIRTRADIVALFTNYPPTTTHGGAITATGGTASAASTDTDPVDFAGGAASYQASFSFNFPASDLFVGVTTQLGGYTARFMTQLPPPAFGIPAAVAGSLDCVTSDTKRAAQFWINSIESRIGDLMTALRQRTPLGPQTPYTA
jgi:hypothetical protein